jgi:hypothetical protein
VYRWSSNETKKSVRFPDGFSMSQFTMEGYRIFEKNSSYETGLYACKLKEIIVYPPIKRHSLLDALLDEF